MSRFSPRLSSFIQTIRKSEAILGLVVVLVLASLYYAQWAYYLTDVTDSKINIDFPQKYFWWADDSREYRATGDWLLGRSQQTYANTRPWLYPLLTGSARAFFGPNGERALWLTQFAMWLTSAGLIYFALRNGAKNQLLAILGAALFFSHPSPLALTFHGMTETLNILLLSALAWILSTQSPRRWLYAIFLFALLTVTKPTYEVQLILLTLIFVVANFKGPKTSKRRLALTLALVLLPVWIQLAVSFSYSGQATISEIGPYTFKNFFVAVVHAREENLPWRESLQVIHTWQLPQQLNYLWMHQRQTLLTFRRNLIDTNMWVGSFFIRGVDNRMIGFVETINAAWLYIHLIMLPVMLYSLLSSQYRQNKILIAALYLTFLIQTLVTGISTGQDDRLTITGIPLWIISYLLTLQAFTRPPAETPA